MLRLLQQAAFNPEVGEEVKKRALMYGSECTTGYIDLLEHVLLVGPACPHECVFFCVCVLLRFQVVAVTSQGKQTMIFSL